MKTACTITLILSALTVPAFVCGEEIPFKTPTVFTEQIILGADEFTAKNENAYLAFPAIVRGDEDHVLISYKRGRSHANDTGAPLEVARFNVVTNEIESRKIVSDDPSLIYQMGEWLRFSDGSLGNFVDVQKVVVDQGKRANHRVGVQFVTTTDSGASYSPMQPWGAIDGVEYGYVFDGVEVNGVIYVLAMTFPELSAAKTRFDAQGKRIYGTVTALSFDGKEWKFERNLTEEFGGAAINESCLIASEDGFIVATRGYDNKARLHRVDRTFEVRQSRNLTEQYDQIRGIVGRPRLFREGDGLYLLGRNYRKTGKMELCLFRVDEESLEVEQGVVLGPRNQAKIVDGYYAMPYFTGSAKDRRLNIITYRRDSQAKSPDIVRLEFDWNEAR
ncbi:hypothetical protein EC9_32910 [Rosistilla ulvae]|uniref:Uncharacterized protein n=1 Tax=Rosistilla ulvae TaxID=1930277 RepID=A0A517M2J2_9BACT|nr:exo-alpha-sialidase [Rosistilla ulvae]QDS89094.1 hypothetical protein EC9_32910 [Rosistilla ulvae]